jgi:hypothetical protein
MEPGRHAAQWFKCEELPNDGVIVSEIRDKDVPESLVCKYFGPKSNKSGWKYNALTIVDEQDAILSLYQRVYEVDDMPNKEISLQFARGLILMSLDERVNWAQFSQERREHRENLKKRATTKAVKKERESEDVLIPSILGKKRCVAEKEGLALKLTIKSESTVEGVVMEKKVSGRGRGKELPISPTWNAEDLESMASVIKKNTKLVEDCRVLLSESIAERGLVEDKLRRARILLSDRQAMMDKSTHQLKELNEQENTLKTVIAQKRSLLVGLEISDSSRGCEESMQLRLDIATDEAKYESFAFKKGLEERTILRSSKAVASCESAILDLESELERSTNKNLEIETRVSSLEGLLQSMEEQLGRMNEGGGTVFFPRPIFGSPITPIVTVHTLNACPVCSFWFNCFDYSSLGCGHTYHPYCLAEHARTSRKCLIKDCQVPFHLQNVVAIGIRPTAGVSSNAAKKTEGSIKKEMEVVRPVRNLSGTHTTSHCNFVCNSLDPFFAQY